jgi:hypothetical protein
MIVELHNCYLLKSINRRTYFIVKGPRTIFFNIQKCCTIVENYSFLRYGPIIYHPPYLFTRTLTNNVLKIGQDQLLDWWEYWVIELLVEPLSY